MKEKEIESYLSVGALILLVIGAATFFYREVISYLILAIFGLNLLAILITKTYFRIQHHLDKIDETLNKVSNENKKNRQFLDNFKTEIAKQNIESIKQNKIGAQKLDRQKAELVSEVSKVKSVTDKFYWHFAKEKRAEHLTRLAPKLFQAKSVLYVGARVDRVDFLADFLNTGSKITLLEIHKPNVDYFKTIPGIAEIIEGDVTKFESEKKFDAVFWWHGPEHIEKVKLAETLAKLESMTKKTIVLGCPWGDVPQGKELVAQNPHEEHRNFFNLGDFEKFGYQVGYSGIQNTSGSNIIAIKNKRWHPLFIRKISFKEDIETRVVSTEPLSHFS